MKAATASFGMGCFWSPDARFGGTKGVLRTRVGYAGGQRPDPTYAHLGDHTETIQIDYDPQQISYEQLLQIFWTGHNPVKPVWGPQYMSVIFYHQRHEQDDAAVDQQRLASASLEAQCYGGLFRLPTQILPMERFYPAEPYHQKYNLRNHRGLMQELAPLWTDDTALLDSTAAARINGALAGYFAIDQLEAELVGLGLPAALARKSVELVREHRRLGGG